jgi:thymidine kinase
MVVVGEQVVIGDVDADQQVAYEVLCRSHHRQQRTARASRSGTLSPQVLPFSDGDTQPQQSR